MSRSALKSWYYLLTAISTIASSLYFNFLFFWLADRFGFGDRENLGVAALHGAVYIVAAVQGGKFAERYGYHTSLKMGFGGLTVCMGGAALAPTPLLAMGVVVVYTWALLFLWPALEALVVDGESPARVPHRVGLYNCTWSATAAVAYFIGGPLYDAYGAWAVVGAPAAVFAAAFVLVFGVERLATGVDRAETLVAVEPVPPHPEPIARQQSVGPETFLRLAWLANPLAYVAIYALLAVMPGLAARLGLSATEAGLYGSLWFFGRMVAFVVLWKWTGWHYRFRWLVSAYVLMTIGFAGCLLAPAVAVLVVAQAVFGLAAGLIYYSSLFYAMDVGTAKAEHGGWHEAMIGVGIFLGPAVGALSLTLFPAVAWATAAAVSLVLVAGLAGLGHIWRRGRRGM